MKTNIFNSKMALFNDSLEELSNYLNISRQTLSLKIQGKSQFKQDEINLIVKRYDLTSEETLEIFFN